MHVVLLGGERLPNPRSQSNSRVNYYSDIIFNSWLIFNSKVQMQQCVWFSLCPNKDLIHCRNGKFKPDWCVKQRLPSSLYLQLTQHTWHVDFFGTLMFCHVQSISANSNLDANSKNQIKMPIWYILLLGDSFIISKASKYTVSYIRRFIYYIWTVVISRSRQWNPSIRATHV